MERSTPGPRQLRRRRASRQLLAGRDRLAPEAIVRRLLAVQSQDLGAARLALRARTPGLAAAQVDRALTEERSLVVAWLGRGTLHLVGAEDYPWLLGLTAPTRAATSRRRLGQEGVTPAQADRAVAVIEAALLDAGALTRAALEERLAACDIPTAGQALPHLLLAAALRGVALLGPVDGAGQRFVLARDWLGSEPPTRLEGDERERSLAELARRYLGGHGPATPADLGSWSGLPLRDARAGLEAIAGELVHLGDDLVDLAGDDPAPGRVPPRLLGAFDPLLLGHRDRDLIVPPGTPAGCIPAAGSSVPSRPTTPERSARGRRGAETSGSRSRSTASRRSARGSRAPCAPRPPTSRGSGRSRSREARAGRRR